MKKILVIAIATMSSLSLYAQSGSFYIGGNAGFNSRTIKTTTALGTVSQKYNTWEFSPEVGTFLTDRWQLGAALTFSGLDKTNYYGGTLYTRYFYGKSPFQPFIGLNITNIAGGNSAMSSYHFNANINVGFAYALNDRITAVGSFGALGYTSTTNKSKLTNTDKIQDSSFGFTNVGTLGNRFTIGIYYTL